MSDKTKGVSRRGFIKSAALGAAAGAGAMLTPKATRAAGKQSRVPTRVFGKNGPKVSMLSLGGMFDIPNNQLILRQALNLGVTYWDTAESYGHGQSETGMGQYLARFKADREKIFLVSKGHSRDPDVLSAMLEKSLKRLQTDYLDLYFVHAISSIKDMTPAIMAWGRSAKQSGMIKRFGFSTHSNMAACLAGAPALGGIDGIMFTYNYRIMHQPAMQKAVEACYQAGIGLTAMKTQGGGPMGVSSESELKLGGRFVKKGFTDKQAKLLAIWEDKRIAALCSQMPNLTILAANAAAAMNRVDLTAGERSLLQQYAAETACGYCAGCGAICQSAVGDAAPVADLMRYLMYYRDYGEPELARELFGEITPEVRASLPSLDYDEAERRCPQGLAIGQLVNEAATLLA